MIALLLLVALSTPVQAFSQATDASLMPQLGEPVSVTVSGPANGGGSTTTATYFLYDGGAPVVEMGASGAVTAANGWGADGWRERAGGNGFFAYAHDPNGSLLARVGSNNVTYPADDFSFYDAYGSLRGDVSVYSGRAVAPRDPMGFGGQFGNYTDTETNLLCLTHRYYDGGTGRFINRDPFGYGGGINLYGFVGNNPVNEMDPEGTNPLDNAQIALTGVGLIPGLGEVADVGSAVVSLAQGDYAGAGLSVVGMVPVLGDGALAAKAIRITAKRRKEAQVERASYKVLRAAGRKDAHHIIQDAAVRDLPGYEKDAAPAVELLGPSNVRTTPHGATRPVQMEPGGGTYAAERRIGYKALRRGGLSPSEARAHIKNADEYFSSIGVTGRTRTRIPGDRR